MSRMSGTQKQKHRDRGRNGARGLALRWSIPMTWTRDVSVFERETGISWDFIKGYFIAQMLHGAGIFPNIYPNKIIQFCRQIYQHHGAYGLEIKGLFGIWPDTCDVWFFIIDLSDLSDQIHVEGSNPNRFQCRLSTRCSIRQWWWLTHIQLLELLAIIEGLCKSYLLF